MSVHSSTGTLVAKDVDDTEGASAIPPLEALRAGGEVPGELLRPSPEQRESYARRTLYRLWWRAHWLAPNFVPPTYHDKAYEQFHDEVSNERSRINDGEELRIRAVWGVELFGPNECDDLYEALRALGWSAGFGKEANGALTWVLRQRAYGHGGIYNVGHVTRGFNPQRFLSNGNRASLPDDVDYLLVEIHQVVPSVTGVVVCFVLKDEATTRYEQELNLIRTSKRERGKHRIVSCLAPSHVKQRAVEVARARFRLLVSEWFRRNLPGYFAGLNLPERFPTAELLCTNVEDVFVEKDRGFHFDWRRIISNVAPQDIWTSKSLSGVRFTLHQERWPGEQANLLIASVAIQSLPEDKIRMYGGGAEAIVAICHQNLAGALACFAISAFLAELARDLKITREELNLSKPNRKTIRTVDRIQRFFDRNAGVPAVARELRKSTEDRGWFELCCGQFTAAPKMDGQFGREFANEIREVAHFQASTLFQDEASTREHFEQLSTILSVRESVRAQRRMEILTIAALLVAALTLVIAIPGDWFSKLMGVVSSLLS